MVDILFSIDTTIFYFFNHTLSNPAFDLFFSFITNVRHWFPVYFILIVYLIVTKKKQGALIVFTLAVLIGFTDIFGYKVLKEFFARPRPYLTLPDVLLPNGKSGTFSFPSNHALNNFALAVFLTQLFPKTRAWLFSIAALIAISRVYTGVHYPSDVLGGAVIGAAFGYLFARLYFWALQRWPALQS